MSNLSIKEKVYKIDMPVDKTYFTLITKAINKLCKESFIMTGITEKEFDKLEKGYNIELERGNLTFDIAPDDICCFGNIDFTEGSEDCDTLDTFNWFDGLGVKGVSIPANYNYKHHQCLSDRKFNRWTETFVISKFCRYVHGVLGKPNYTLIFRMTI